MVDEDLEEMRIELRDLREFKRIVLENFDALIYRPRKYEYTADELPVAVDVTYDKHR